jgi:hypothetical protein
MSAMQADGKVRTMLPFRVCRGRGDGAVFLEFAHESVMFDGSTRVQPYQVQVGQPIIDPALRLMEMYAALEDSLAPLRKDLDEALAELRAVKAENANLHKSVSEYKRQNEALRKAARG